MKTSLNIPYVKKYEGGKLANPIIGNYMAEHPNRKQRRSYLNVPRFFGCGDNFHLTVTPIGKYKRVRQFESDKVGNIKVIEHYIQQA